MGRGFELQLTSDGDAAIVVTGEFSDAEHARLTQYLQQYDDLAESKPGREGVPLNLRIHWAQDAPMTTSASLPDDDTLGLLLHRLRPFILQNEPASFSAVSGIIGRRVQHAHIRALLKQQNRTFSGRESQSVMTIAVNDVVLNSERVLSDWLNSYEYHRDPDKRESTDALLLHLPPELPRAVMVSLLLDKVRAITNVARLVSVLLGRTKTLQFGLEKN